MLVLTRKVGERILIGDCISVTVVRLGPGICTARRGSTAQPDDHSRRTQGQGPLPGNAREADDQG